LKSAGVPRPIAAAAGSAAACVVTVPADIVTQRMQVSWTSSWFSARPGGHFRVIIPCFQVCLLLNPFKFARLSNAHGGFSILKLEEGVRACLESAQLGSVCQQPPELMLSSYVQVGLHANAFQALGSILKTKGVGGLYAGLSPALARIIPTAVIQVRLSPVCSFQLWQCF
jgi:hypothetical protein